MKALIGLLVLATSIANADPNPPEVIEVLHDQTSEVSLEVAENTFIWNIQGYACPWPGIQIPQWQIWGTALRHRMGGGFMVDGKSIALGIVDPNQEFCQGGDDVTPEKVFGISLVPGEKHKLMIRVVRDIVLLSNWDNTKKTKVLRETITTQLGQREIYSEATVSLEPATP